MTHDKESLLQAWMDAERAREEHAAQFFMVGSFGDGGPVEGPARVLDALGMQELKEHEEAEQKARQAYYESVSQNR